MPACATAAYVQSTTASTHFGQACLTRVRLWSSPRAGGARAPAAFPRTGAGPLHGRWHAKDPYRSPPWSSASAASTVGLAASGPRATAAMDPVVAAAGDIACAPPGTRTASKCHQADRRPARRADAVLPIGDEQYNCGQLSAFNQVYNPSWVGSTTSAIRPSATTSTPATAARRRGRAATTPISATAPHPGSLGCTINCQDDYSYDVGSWHRWRSIASAPSRASVAARPPHRRPGGSRPTWPPTPKPHPGRVPRPYFSDKGWHRRQGQTALSRPSTTAAPTSCSSATSTCTSASSPTAQSAPPKATGSGSSSSGPAAGARHAGLPRPRAGRRAEQRHLRPLEADPAPDQLRLAVRPRTGKTFTDTGTQACH